MSKSAARLNRIIFCVLLLSAVSFLKATGQEFAMPDSDSSQHYHYVADSFRLHLCNKTRNDPGIIGAILIDVGKDSSKTVRNDAIKRINLLAGDTAVLKCGENYHLIFIGKNKWNHLTYFTGKCINLIRIINGVGMTSAIFCYDRLKNKHKSDRHWRKNDYYTTFDGFIFIGGFSKRIKKRRKSR